MNKDKRGNRKGIDVKRVSIKVKILLGMLFIIIIGSVGVSKYKGYEVRKDQIQRQAILNIPLVPLTKEQKIEDFEYLYKIIKENYPFLEVNKRMNGIDWLANKDKYLNLIQNISEGDDQDYKKVLDIIMSDLNNGHTHILTREHVKVMKEGYYHAKQQGVWQGINYDVLNNPYALRRYGMDISVGESKDTENDGNAKEEIQTSQVITKDVVEGKVAYMHIPKMLSSWEREEDETIIIPYLEKVKDYNALIIDIRGNGGGDSKYWSDFLIPRIIRQSYASEQYTFYKGGEEIQTFIKAHYKSPIFIKKVSDLDKDLLPNIPEEVYTDFTYYEQSTSQVKPHSDSIHFKGKIYLLVDRGVCSSAESLAVFAKDSGLAILIGEKTGGDGIGSDPMLTMLPNSGLVVRYSKDLGTNRDGTCNEEYKTVPDYMIQNPARSTNFIKDECIKKVLELEGIK